jgi:predicted hotdog family 3-hydroxylacyl-ACP dehydratase
MAAYPPIDDLVPHAPPMRAIEELIDWEPGRARCRMILRAHSVFAQGHAFAQNRVFPQNRALAPNRNVPTIATLEFLAQSVAACLGYEAFQGGGTVRVGMIVGVRQMDFFVPFMNVGDELILDVSRIRGTEDVSTFVGEARIADTLVSRAHMTLVHPAVAPA